MNTPASRLGLACWLVIATPGFVAFGLCFEEGGDWEHYGGDAGGARYSALDQIDRSNVGRLSQAWSFASGDLSDGSGKRRESKFEATPIFFEGLLYFSTPFNRVIALDPLSGAQRWSYDPQIDLEMSYSESLVSRGVSAWVDQKAQTGTPCSRRIFLAALDARLIALDAKTGLPCSGFGGAGQVDLKTGVGKVEIGQYLMTSPPAIIDGTVVVGSSLGDNRRIEMERGTVRGYDARDGRLRWSWDPIPRRPGPGYETWTPEAARITGGANAWSIISGDPERGLVFIPTGSAAPDFYGGLRKGANLFANSVVALRASSGELVWHFQAVHHDLWDYDVASQPTLTVVRRGGRSVPAVVVNTKMGHVFVLDRETGKPLDPVEEKAVPPSDVPGEQASPTQPFPPEAFRLHDDLSRPLAAWGLNDEEKEACQRAMQPLRYQGIFTPPSLEGSLFFPGNLGGVNWGGAAVDPHKGIMIVNLNRLATLVRLIPRDEFRKRRAAAQRDRMDLQFTSQSGTPFGMARRPLLSPEGLPCTPPPWGKTIGFDLNSGKTLWEIPTGSLKRLGNNPEVKRWGSVSLGGPIITASGLVFVAGGMDDRIRALDSDTGRELWSAELPAGGQATPMTYLAGGRQFVVIAAGGREGWGRMSDQLVAFALPARNGAK